MTGAGVVIALMAVGAAVDPSSPSARNEALLGEVFHLQRALGTSIWPTWSPEPAPFLLRTSEQDLLIHHPRPPESFREAGETLLGGAVWSRPVEDGDPVAATYPIDDVFTVVISEWTPDEDPCVWVLTAVHELFHVHQHAVRADRVVDPFRGDHASDNELTYPYPFERPSVTALMRMEAETVFQAIMSPEFTDIDAGRARKLLHHARTVAADVFDDPLDWTYKQWMEWNEGAARYTERRLADLSRDSSRYEPSAAFREHFPEAEYGDAWDARYAGMLNPIRFVGEGVKGRVMFYYTGMGKAYLLDRLRPDWHEHYFDESLDVLIEGSP